MKFDLLGQDARSRAVPSVFRVKSNPAGASGFTAAQQGSTLASDVSVHPDLMRIQRALAGDAACLTELIDEMTPVVQHRVARALLLGARGKARNFRPEVEDFTQEVLLGLFANGGRLLLSWVPERGLSFKGFVGLLAERQAGATLRSRRRSPFSAEPTEPGDLDLENSDDALDASRVTESRQLLDLIAHRLQARLSPAGLAMFHQLYVAEKSPEEVSKETGLSLESIYQWRSRIRKAALDARSELSAERIPQAGQGSR